MPSDPFVRLLLVEDDPDDAVLVRHALAGHVDPAGDFELEEAPSLERAIEALSRGSYDLAILDLGLPGTQGLETLAALRRRFPDLPVVVLTGYSDERAACEAVERGAQDYLLKGELQPRALRRAALYAAARGRLAAQERRVRDLAAEVAERRRVDGLKDRFFSAAAHELRSPVTVVRAALQTLQEGGAGPLGAEQAFLADLALRNALHLARMLDDFLDLSRIEAGAVIVERMEFDPREALEEAARAFGLVGRRRGIVLTLDAPAELPRLRADPGMFRRILSNLLDNALRFARSSVTLAASASPGSLEVLVQDDGPGIPQGSLRAVFSRFTQAGRAAGEDGYKGTGLGLSLCKEMAELNGGDITAESPPGSGARFVVTLPLAAPSPR